MTRTICAQRLRTGLAQGGDNAYILDNTATNVKREEVHTVSKMPQ
jgi:hypothetical protein